MEPSRSHKAGAPARVGIIGGSGMQELFAGGPTVEVETPFGRVGAATGEVDGVGVAVILRHGPDHQWLPHEVNYRGNLWALKTLGVRDVFATVACGSLRPELGPGDLAVVVDFLDFTRERPQTCRSAEGLPTDAEFFHIDMHQPYCPRLRGLLMPEHGGPLPEVVYACGDGPRYESPAEIRMMAQVGGEVIGMTGVPEVVLARELGLCYASLAVITNAAAGLGTEALEHGDVEREGRRLAPRVRELLRQAIPRAADDAASCCPAARRRARWFPGEDR